MTATSNNPTPKSVAPVSRAYPSPKKPPLAPWLFPAIGLILGIAADNALSLSPYFPIAMALLASIPLLLGRNHPGILVAVILTLSCALGILRHAIADRAWPEHHISQYTGNQSRLIRIEGFVRSPPTIHAPDKNAPRNYPRPPTTRFTLRATQIPGQTAPITVTGDLYITVRDALLHVQQGDLVAITGWLYRPRGPANPGAYDWALYMRRNGILSALACDHAESVQILKPSHSHSLLHRIRARLHSYLVDTAFPDPEDSSAGIISSIVIGRRSAVPREIDEAFIMTGNAHILAASGMNIAWLALIGWAVCRCLELDRRPTAVIVGLLILSFVLIAEPQPSILRAGIVGLILCAAAFRGGPFNSTNALALSAVIILLIQPNDLFRQGFQFSYIATIVLLKICPPFSAAIASALSRLGKRGHRLRRIAAYFDPNLFITLLVQTQPSKRPFLESWRDRLGILIAQFTAIALSEWLLTSPLQCYYFNTFCPVGWLGGLLAVPLAAIAATISYVALLTQLVFPSTAPLFAFPVASSTNLLAGLVQGLAKLPFSQIYGRSPSALWVAGAYALVAFCKYRRPSPRKKRICAIASAAILGWWLVWPWFIHHRGDALRVWNLAVGGGSAAIIELPNGQTWLYDLGTRSNLNPAQIASDFLRTRGIDHIDIAFVSHPDFDHYGGLPALAREIPIARLIINDHFARFAPKDSPAAQFLAEINKLGIPIETYSGRLPQLDSGSVDIESLWPPPAADLTIHDSNDTSTVLRLDYQDRRILLAGDIADQALAALLNLQTESVSPPLTIPILKADAVLLPHHGAVTSNTSAFIAAVNPTAAIRSSQERDPNSDSNIAQICKPRAYLNTADLGCVLIEIANGAIESRAVMSLPR